jgi:transposase
MGGQFWDSRAENLAERAKGPLLNPLEMNNLDKRTVVEKIGFPEYAYLLTIPGFGPDVSSKVLGAIGDPFRFTRANQVLKTAGLDLSADRSGKRCDGVVPVISKNGKADLRYALNRQP